MSLASLVGRDYPKSSIGLSECPAYPHPQEWPIQRVNQLSANNLYLDFPEQLAAVGQCVSSSAIADEVQPTPWVERDAFTVLNSDFGLETAPSFYRAINSGCDCDTPEGRLPLQVTASDPRLMYPIRGGSETQVLDQAPYTGAVRLNKIYDDRYTRYGKDYRTYADINAGQIMYYLDNNLAPAFHLPTSTITSKIDVSMFQTPMTSYWPQYKKTPLSRECKYLSDQQFTRDTVRNREELMALQNAPNLRTNWPVG